MKPCTPLKLKNTQHTLVNALKGRRVDVEAPVTEALYSCLAARGCLPLLGIYGCLGPAGSLSLALLPFASKPFYICSVFFCMTEDVWGVYLGILGLVYLPVLLSIHTYMYTLCCLTYLMSAVCTVTPSM